MDVPPLGNNRASLEAYDAESALTNWLKTIIEFHNYYHQLISCTNWIANKQELKTSNAIYVGQCPVNLLIDLTSTMQEELNNLSQDMMDQLPSLESSTKSKNYRKLADHTRLLSQLNQQAKNRLYLVALPNS